MSAEPREQGCIREVLASGLAADGAEGWAGIGELRKFGEQGFQSLAVGFICSGEAERASEIGDDGLALPPGAEVELRGEGGDAVGATRRTEGTVQNVAVALELAEHILEMLVTPLLIPPTAAQAGAHGGMQIAIREQGIAL